MVGRIVTGKKMIGALYYNYHKVEQGQAEILFSHRTLLIPGGNFSMETAMRSFEPYLNHPKSRIKYPVIHISLNPHPVDNLSDEQLQDVARFYMDSMGYGEQPYVVFRHWDTGRPHLHIVSVRSRLDGSTIDDSFEHERSVAVTKEIESRFSLHPAIEEKRIDTFRRIKRIDYETGNLKQQIKSVVLELTDRYNFCSRNELNTLLGLFGITVTEHRGEASGKPYEGVSYSAIDEEGNKIGKPIKSSLINRSVGYKALQKRYAAALQWLAAHPGEIEGRKQHIRKAMQDAHNITELSHLLRQDGVSCMIRKTRTGRIYGITFIDHTLGMVYNGSRLGKEFSANSFNTRFFHEETISDNGSQSIQHDIERQSYEDVLSTLILNQYSEEETYYRKRIKIRGKKRSL